MKNAFSFQKENLLPTTDKGALRRVLIGGIRRRTFKDYRQKYLRYVQFVLDHSVPYDKESLKCFLLQLHAQGASGSTVAKHRVAVSFLQKLREEETWASHPDLVLLTSSMEHMSRKSGAKRGAISTEMLEQLCVVCDSDERQYATLFRLLFYGILRWSQAYNVRSGDIIRKQRSTYVILRRDKRARRGSNRSIVHERRILWPQAEWILEELTKKIPRGKRLFAWASHSKANQLIKKAARRFSWPQKLAFDGVHCLRHGGAQATRERLEVIEKVGGEGAAMAPRTWKWYSRVNH